MDAVDLLLKRNISHVFELDDSGLPISKQLIAPITLHQTTPSYSCVLLRPDGQLFGGVSADVLTVINSVSPGRSSENSQTMLLQDGEIEQDHETGSYVFARRRAIDLLVPPKELRASIRTYRASDNLAMRSPVSGHLVVHRTVDDVYYLLVVLDDPAQIDVLFACSEADFRCVKVWKQHITTSRGRSVYLGEALAGEPVITLSGVDQRNKLSYAAGLFHEATQQYEMSPITGVDLPSCRQITEVVNQLCDAASDVRVRYDFETEHSALDLQNPPEGWYRESLGGYVMPLLYQGESINGFGISGLFKPSTDHLYRVL